MYLKRLEIQGFKSFADPLKLDFSKEITAVVGPNGSGKAILQMLFAGYWGNKVLKPLEERRWKMLFFQGLKTVNL